MTQPSPENMEVAEELAMEIRDCGGDFECAELIAAALQAKDDEIERSAKYVKSMTDIFLIAKSMESRAEPVNARDAEAIAKELAGKLELFWIEDRKPSKEQLRACFDLNVKILIEALAATGEDHHDE